MSVNSAQARGLVAGGIRRRNLARVRFALLASTLGVAVTGVGIEQVSAHGDVIPQPVDTTGLAPLGDEWLEANPYPGNEVAEHIGAHGYKINCLRCHGADGESNGLAPDLRELPPDADGDEFYIQRVRNGVVRNGSVKCPKFEGIMSQEAMWAIRAWLLTKNPE